MGNFVHATNDTIHYATPPKMGAIRALARRTLKDRKENGTCMLNAPEIAKLLIMVLLLRFRYHIAQKRLFMIFRLKF